MPGKTTKVQDLYGNRAFVDITMTAANTLTFQQIQFGVGLFQGVALVLNRIEWYPDRSVMDSLVANSDELKMALTNRDDLSAIDASNQSILAMKQVDPLMVGAVVGIEIVDLPWVSDFSGIPGAGLIIPANPLYVGVYTVGFAAAARIRCILYFTFKTLTDAEYIELIQTIMPANL